MPKNVIRPYDISWWSSQESNSIGLEAEPFSGKVKIRSDFLYLHRSCYDPLINGLSASSHTTHENNVFKALVTHFSFAYFFFSDFN